MNDTGLKSVGQLAGLTKLELYNTHVTDAGVKELASLTRLCELTIGSFSDGLTDECFQHLVPLTSLRHLVIMISKGDRGLKKLSALKNLANLDLNCQVTEAGLTALSSLEGLTSLSIRDVEGKETGIKQLLELKHLRTLWIPPVWSTDVGLKELARMKTLHSLTLKPGTVTSAGLQEFRKSLPNCQIIWR